MSIHYSQNNYLIMMNLFDLNEKSLCEQLNSYRHSFVQVNGQLGQTIQRRLSVLLHRWYGQLSFLLFNEVWNVESSPQCEVTSQNDTVSFGRFILRSNFLGELYLNWFLVETTLRLIHNVSFWIDYIWII